MSKLPQVDRTPTSDAMRQRLGGRIGDGSMEGAGRAVLVVADTPQVGVLLSEDEESLFVWLDEAVVRRVARDVARPYEGFVEPEIARRQEEARRYAGLKERTFVVAVTPRGQERVFLVEKCRFGALVERDDGKLAAIGFASLVPGQDGLH